MQVENVKVDMLGGFSVWVNGTEVVNEAPKLTKPWQLFCYLLLHREKFVSNRKLISMLWADDELTDPANVLKNAIYSLRKELCGGESSTESPIIYSSGGYRFDPAVKLDLDADRFERLCDSALSAPAESEEKLELCRQVLDAYSGDFLPMLDQDLWVVPLTLGYKQQYLECMHELCEILWRKEEYRELLEVCTTAISLEPLDETLTVYMFRAMEALKMLRVIVTTYSKIAREYEEELGGEPPAEAQRIYRAASERINKTEQDIIVIKTEITGGESDTRSQRGAYFCSYSGLKQMYALMKRSAERNNQSLVLALFTLDSVKGIVATPFDMNRAMAEFKVVALNNLRKTDAIARYSKNQYVMLMSVTSLDDGRIVRDRIKEKYARTTASSLVDVDVKLTEV